MLSFNTQGKLWLNVFRPQSAKSPVLQQKSAVVTPGGAYGTGTYSILPPTLSGGGNSVFTASNGNIFVAYPAHDSNYKNTIGTPAYIRQFQLAADGTPLSAVDPVFLGISGDLSMLEDSKLPSPDDHDDPAITADQNGLLTVVLGAHNGLFKMMKSIKAGTATSGWTPPAPFGVVEDYKDKNRAHKNLESYTYASLNTDTNGNIHVFARYASNSYIHTLVQMRMTPNSKAPNSVDFQSWSNSYPQAGSFYKNYGSFLPHRVIADPQQSGYAVWRHKVTLDKKGNLYLFFYFWTCLMNDTEHGKLAPNAQYTAAANHCDNAYPSLKLTNYDSLTVPHLYPTILISTDGGSTFSSFAAGDQSVLP